MNEPNFKEIFAAAFGRELTAPELWAITNFAKRVRKYARNNSAFNNLANRVFPYARFRQVPKSRPSWKVFGKMERYEGLQITVNGQATEIPDGD